MDQYDVIEMIGVGSFGKVRNIVVKMMMIMMMVLKRIRMMVVFMMTAEIMDDVDMMLVECYY